MNLPFGFGIDKDIILAHPTLALFIVLILLFCVIVIFLYLLNKVFGVKDVLLKVFNYIHKLLQKRKIPDWIANCKLRTGRKQNQAILPINLEGKHLKQLSFNLTSLTKNKTWRAGIMIGNADCQGVSIVDTQNAVTIHVGSNDFEIDDGQQVWIYDKENIINNPKPAIIENKSDNAKFEIK